MDDLISRQTAIEKLISNLTYMHTFGADRSIDLIEELPSAQPERKLGKWINGTCNQCGSHAPYWAMATTYYRSNFCPNCGADMREVDDE